MPILAVIWRAAGLLFATDVRLVMEVLPPLGCTPAPIVPNWIRGLFCYRGKLIPLVQASTLLDMPRVPDRMFNRVLVVRCGVGTETVEFPVGLWVECVLEIERLDVHAAGHHSGFETRQGRFLGPVVQTRWGQVQLVEPGEIFSPEQASVLSERLKEAAA